MNLLRWVIKKSSGKNIFYREGDNMKRMYGYVGLIISAIFITFVALGLAIYANISTKEIIGIIVIVVILFVVIGIVFNLFSKPKRREKVK